MGYYDEIVKTVQPDFAELFTFTIGYDVWRYTSYSNDVTFQGYTFAAASMKRGEWSEEIDLKPLSVKITLPITDLAAKFVANYPNQKVYVEIIRVFIDDPSSFLSLFKGAVTNVVLNKNTAEIDCESSSLVYSFRVPRVVHQAFCNNRLFDLVCGLDSESYSVFVQGITVSGGTITHATIDTYADGYFQMGRAKTIYGDERMITGHVGSSITLQVPFDTRVSTGGKLYLYPGCDKAFSTCKNRFNNLANFVGFPYIPSNNPAIYGVEQTQ